MGWKILSVEHLILGLLQNGARKLIVRVELVLVYLDNITCLLELFPLLCLSVDEQLDVYLAVLFFIHIVNMELIYHCSSLSNITVFGFLSYMGTLFRWHSMKVCKYIYQV